MSSNRQRKERKAATAVLYYYQCQRKMDLYREGLIYGSSHWNTRTAHHKPTNKDEE